MAKNKDKQSPTPEDDMAAQRLLREADEALRQDKMQALWDEWGSTIIGAVLMIILGTSLGVAWQSWQADRQATATAQLLQADRTPDARAELSGHYKGVAALLAAARTAGGEDVSPETLNSLFLEATDSGLPVEWDFLAAWGRLRTQAEQSQNNEETLAIATEMAELARDRDNPYTAIMLMEAGVIQGSIGNFDTAISLLEEAAETPAATDLPDVENRIESYKQLYQTEAAL